MGDEAFWAATERAEEEFTGMADVDAFRKRMIRIGHEPSIIRDRVSEIYPNLVEDFDRLQFIAERKARSLSKDNGE